MRRWVVYCAWLSIVFCASLASADIITPLDDVVTGVIVRASASSSSAIVGTLRPGEQAQLLGSVPNWHRIQLANGQTGFVSKRWTRVIPEVAPAPTTTTFTIDVVDVGTGLAVLVRGPDFTLVYDAGSNDDTARGSANRMLTFIKAVAPTLTSLDHGTPTGTTSNSCQTSSRPSRCIRRGIPGASTTSAGTGRF
jgi:beta-lactamase superfamily II metal-dependent hydrolase